MGQESIDIADVKENGSWFEVYDEDGKKVSSMASSNKELLGYGDEFFVVLSGSWIETYDVKCKKIAYMPSTNKTVKGVAGGVFTVINGPWVETYDKHCKKLNTRSAR